MRSGNKPCSRPRRRNDDPTASIAISTFVSKEICDAGVTMAPRPKSDGRILSKMHYWLIAERGQEPRLIGGTPSTSSMASFQKRVREMGVPRIESKRFVPARIVVPQTIICGTNCCLSDHLAVHPPR